MSVEHHAAGVVVNDCVGMDRGVVEELDNFLGSGCCGFGLL